MPHGMGYGGQADMMDRGGPGGVFDFWKQLFRDFKTGQEQRGMNRRINLGRLANADLYEGEVPLAGTMEERQTATEDFFRGLGGENDPSITVARGQPAVRGYDEMSQAERAQWNRYMTKLAAGMGDPEQTPPVVPPDWERQRDSAIGKI